MTLLKLSVFTAVMALVLTGLIVVFSEYRSGDTEKYNAVFTDVSGLESGDKVRIAGVEVGRVDKIYPALVSSLITAINGAKDTGEIKVDFNLQINETPPCTTGFLNAEDRRSPADLSVPPLMNGIYCKVPADSQTVVRGARNLPCMEYPGRRAASPAECAANNYVPEGTNPPDTSEVGPPGDNPNAYNVVPSSTDGEPEIRTSAAMYQPATGEYLGADGKTYRQLNLGAASKLSADADLADILTNGVT
ncbi:MlaD family protein [Rhodococcus sp. IEGM 1408]|uniref:MlaD family protein n=1 Tax=Rhodococcus sp. IEGM 1408 TaxID=3082220 RepID=UPI002954477F|nr:MlaD family protein [Rhodococcus sp. IEGM 1408]MDV8002454.1 MlaD family protein [Rhodococcus sp. IEGM 1408]